MEGWSLLKIADPNERNLLLAYIADRLPSSDRESFERRLLEDEAFSQRIEEAEFALLEEYVDGSLTKHERATVAAWITDSPVYRKHVEITAVLRGMAVAKPANRSFARLFAWPLSVAACVVCIVAVLLLHQQWSPPEHPMQLAQVPTTPATSSAQPQDTILLEAQRLRGSAKGQSATELYTVHTGFPTRLQIIVPRGALGDPYSLDLHPSGDPLGQLAVHVGGLKAHTETSVPYVEVLLSPSSLTQKRYVGTLRSQGESYDLAFSVRVAQ